MILFGDDIADVAEALVDELHANPDVTFAGILAGPTFERRIAEVLADERERCAEIAATYAANMSIWLSSEWPTAKLTARIAASEIAAAIRNPSPGA